MKIEHISAYLSDIDEGKEFFEKFFEGTSSKQYHNKSTGFRSYFISFDDGSRLEIMSKPDHKLKDVESRIGYAHLAMSVGSKEKVDELTKALKDNGFKVVSGPRTTGDGYYESCVKGVEDILIEITV